MDVLTLNNDDLLFNKKIRFWSDCLFLESIRPSAFLKITNPEQYKKEFKKYRKTKSIQFIKMQPFFN